MIIPHGVGYWETDAKLATKERYLAEGVTTLVTLMRSKLEERVNDYDMIWEDVCYEMSLCLMLSLFLDGKRLLFGGFVADYFWCTSYSTHHYAATQPPPSSLLPLHTYLTHTKHHYSLQWLEHHYQPCKVVCCPCSPPSGPFRDSQPHH